MQWRRKSPSCLTVNCGCTAFLHNTLTGSGASYELTSSWTPSWPGPRADTSGALFSLYKVNYTSGGCHFLHKWGKPEMKPYHKMTCQRRAAEASPAVLSSQLCKAAAWVLLLQPQATRAAPKHARKGLGALGLLGLLHLLASGACFTAQFEDSLWSTL